MQKWDIYILDNDIRNWSFALANMLLISNKISINKNKQIYFFSIFLYWYFTLPHGSGDWAAIYCESWVTNPLEKVIFTKTCHWLSISYNDKKDDSGLFQVDSVTIKKRLSGRLYHKNNNLTSSIPISIIEKHSFQSRNRCFLINKSLQSFFRHPWENA